MVPSFYTAVLQKSPVFRSAVPVRDPQWLEPEFRDRVMKLIADAEAAGHELRILETYRSQELQTTYYERGATQLRTVGVHHFGLACDLGIVVAGQVNWKADYGILGELARKHRLVWGGDWGTPDRPHSFRDYDHLQRIDVADQRQLFEGNWYPSDSYEPTDAG